jgi:hypothetical protein
MEASREKCVQLVLAARIDRTRYATGVEAPVSIVERLQAHEWGAAGS